MKRPLLRMIALLLVPCLIADPLAAVVFPISARESREYRTATRAIQSRICEEALNLSPGGMITPILVAAKLWWTDSIPSDLTSPLPDGHLLAASMSDGLLGIGIIRMIEHFLMHSEPEDGGSGSPLDPLQANGTPSHWKDWPRPSPADLEDANALLLQLASSPSIHKGDLFTKAVEFGPGRKAFVLRAAYFEAPDIAAALMASFGYYSHNEMSHILDVRLGRYGRTVVETDMLIDIFNRALQLAERAQAPASPHDPPVIPDIAYRGVPFAAGVDYEGIGGILGYMDAAIALTIFRGLDQRRRTKVIDRMMYVAFEKDETPNSVIDQTVLLLESLAPGDLPAASSTLSFMNASKLRALVSSAEAKRRQIQSNTKKSLVYFGGFQEPIDEQDLRLQIGSKAANLVEMSRLGLPVPPGFTLRDSQTGRLQRYGILQELKTEIINAMSTLEAKVRDMTEEPLRFGDGSNLLLLAVRAGAAESSPGQYLTVNRVGLHASTLDAYARELGNPFQARMDYLRHMADYVEDVHRDSRGGEAFFNFFSKNVFFEAYSKGAFATLSEYGSLHELDRLMDEANALYTSLFGRPFPAPYDQLFESIAAVAASYPERTLGKGITVEWEVLGNIDDQHSLSGVAFTRNPFNGAKEIVGTYQFAREGRDIVQPRAHHISIRSNDQEMRYEDLRARLPDAYEQLVLCATRLERHFHSIQDMEIVVSKGRLFIVQTRDNLSSTTPMAQVRTLIDLVHEGVLDEAEALQRSALHDLEWLKFYLEQPLVKASSQSKAIARGIPLFPGVAQAPVAIGSPSRDTASSEQIYFVRSPFELLGGEANFSELFRQNHPGGIVAQAGGYSDHAAVALRRANKRIPFVIIHDMDPVEGGIRVAGHLIRPQDQVVLDGNTGNLYLQLGPEDFEASEVMQVLDGKIEESDSTLYPYFQTLLRWIDIKKNGGNGPTNTPRNLQGSA